MVQVAEGAGRAVVRAEAAAELEPLVALTTVDQHLHVVEQGGGHLPRARVLDRRQPHVGVRLPAAGRGHRCRPQMETERHDQGQQDDAPDAPQRTGTGHDPGGIHGGPPDATLDPSSLRPFTRAIKVAYGSAADPSSTRTRVVPLHLEPEVNGGRMPR
jgi:hypothetical protein